jgi:exoribonuclease-2
MSQHERLLVELAHQAMIDKGLEPDFSDAIERQLAGIQGPARERDASIKDMRELPWCSIDNDDSRDLDQLTWAKDEGGGKVRIFIAVADVDALVAKDTPIDRRARKNTTSVYTAAKVFPMLPEKLSTDLTSLNEGEDRIALVIELLVNPDGSAGEGNIYRALVHNQAKLAYDRVAAWFDGKDDMPEKVGAV